MYTIHSFLIIFLILHIRKYPKRDSTLNDNTFLELVKIVNKKLKNALKLKSYPK
jgi:hypothetical protein